ncbi:uncharacterized protein PHACADRAFT_246057 [Phanerochaete carnosa HHB-10118-sp]|uniref:Uncharacterized protein n=1 Tax=Phanerochaete carnosa (strain HHB-10118-sp) TaxID=650164 RepID=K5WLY8_PHACS|nr:uncharacterized protein PHACADRAFT_246057 [Phanerochaete carnosa HHB-10118-sp]EKM60204.1 hypothetical protein PHACADRAFT_246057 [Phanerochaete carnosa HHB-10118-sp]
MATPTRLAVVLVRMHARSEGRTSHHRHLFQRFFVNLRCCFASGTPTISSTASAAFTYTLPATSTAQLP